MPSGKVEHHPGWKPLQGSAATMSQAGLQARAGSPQTRYTRFVCDKQERGDDRGSLRVARRVFTAATTATSTAPFPLVRLLKEIFIWKHCVALAQRECILDRLFRHAHICTVIVELEATRLYVSRARGARHARPSDARLARLRRPTTRARSWGCCAIET